MIEVLAVLGLLALVTVGLVQLNLTFSHRVSSTSLNIKAEAEAVETMEALRALRDESWANLSGLLPNTSYYLSYSSSLNKWIITNSDPGPIEGTFERSFKVFQVYRDTASGSIISAGGISDANTLRIESEISWNDHGILKNEKLISYLSNF